ncbi:hypothetical protein Pla86_52930 (plasmid) [Planctomycetes bacterium Pla86]|uniref:Uncharacterized protein n=1 Tax=Engelhardtia mirabilis TaxID=2528011 RepID=A0A518BT77_9BACT|nr:hypothetical protein Pla133_52930 [Planctomycetes bacterium Pla133]QDV04497.1 hypothetical protein Pla86_52930 [Planctomycetes bacterium Pla86]
MNRRGIEERFAIVTLEWMGYALAPMPPEASTRLLRGESAEPTARRLVHAAVIEACGRHDGGQVGWTDICRRDAIAGQGSRGRGVRHRGHAMS